MKLVVFLACLSLVAYTNASENYWCVNIEYNSETLCDTCYNSDVFNGKCNGTKIEGCTLAYRSHGATSTQCLQCEIGYYSSKQGQGPACLKVPTDKLVDNCVNYFQDKDGSIICNECGKDFMPGLNEQGIINNTCARSLFDGCDR